MSHVDKYQTFKYKYNYQVLHLCIAAPRSTQPSTLHGMVK